MVIQCGSRFYDKHKEEIKEITDKISKSIRDEKVIKDYIQNFFDNFNGGRNSTALTGRVDSYFIEQTEKQNLENRKKELEKQFKKGIESISEKEK